MCDYWGFEFWWCSFEEGVDVCFGEEVVNVDDERVEWDNLSGVVVGRIVVIDDVGVGGGLEEVGL